MAPGAFVCFISLSVLGLVNLTPLVLLEEEYRFKEWMSEHNKVYEIEEYYHRLQIFTENKRNIDRHNAGNHSFTMGLNQFSDMTSEEFRKSVLLTEPQNCSATKGSHVSRNGPYPEFVDWRKRGNFVSPVKNQGHCGSCWTFSTTGCLESVTAIATGKLLLLSEQQLIDCAQDFNNHGCMGLYDENGMVDAVARLNPVSFGYQVTADFMHYKEGVYTSTRCKNTTDMVNHAVLAVGYGATENGMPYWIVKNSWGTAWGMEGYFLIERGKNMCGLAACSSYPLPLF
uniref:Cathepsin H n=1 Tax=Myripristis murdjan TaxID=586833 RepID=A0A667ZUU0_9TELE